MNIPLKTDLNTNQQKASRVDKNKHLIIAGAGTGKTKTIVQKVINCLNYTSGERILLLTFSKRAAEEMKERIVSKQYGDAMNIHACTFHSFALQILKDYNNILLTISGFRIFPRIIDEIEERTLILQIIKKYQNDFMGIPDMAILSLLKKFNTNENIKKIKALQISSLLKNIKQTIEREKKERALISYEDIMNYSVKILQRDEKARNEFQSKYDYICVDEYQDTSHNNFRLLQLILSEKTGFTAA